MDIIEDFGDLIVYIKKFVLESETDEVEADDLTISIYEDSLSIQVNALYDGLIYEYEKEEDKITVEIPDGRPNGGTLYPDEVIQAAAMVKVLKNHTDLLKGLLV